MFCTGFYQEIARQATLDNNVLLYNKAQQNTSNYGDESLVLASRQALPPDPNAWLKRGAQAAGSEIWDMAPMVDVPGMIPTRTKIIASHASKAQATHCQKTSADARHGSREFSRRMSALAG
jgi:hypothetical protein